MITFATVHFKILFGLVVLNCLMPQGILLMK